jgi:hypothetical protein
MKKVGVGETHERKGKSFPFRGDAPAPQILDSLKRYGWPLLPARNEQQGRIALISLVTVPALIRCKK